jgi:Cation efflux family
LCGTSALPRAVSGGAGCRSPTGRRVVVWQVLLGMVGVKQRLGQQPAHVHVGGGVVDEGARRAANRAVAVSALGLAATGLVEIVLALATGSVALLADALHNLSDVSSSAIVFLGFKVSKRPPSPAYPYGYERRGPRGPGGGAADLGQRRAGRLRKLAQTG